MGIFVSLLFVLLIGGLLDMMWNWCVCYFFLLVFCVGVIFSMVCWMLEMCLVDVLCMCLFISYKMFFGNSGFNCYLLMLIGGLVGIVVFEVCFGVLMGVVLGLSSMMVSILFILLILVVFFGVWFVGCFNKCFSMLMW